MKIPVPKALRQRLSPQPKPKAKKRRKPLRGHGASSLAVAGLLVVCMVPSLWFERAAVAQWLVTSGVVSVGSQPLDLKIEQLDTTTLQLAEVAYGEGAPIRVGTVEATYTIGGLLGGRLETLRVSGLRMRGRWDDDGVVIDGLAQAEGAEDGRSPIVLPADNLTLEDGSLELQTPDGAASVMLAATIGRRPDDAYDLDLSADVSSPAGTARLGAKGMLVIADDGMRIAADTEFSNDAYGVNGGLTGRITGEIRGANASARMAVSDAHARHAIGGIAGAVGEIEWTQGAQGLEVLRIVLAFDQLNTAGQPLERGTVNVVVAEGQADMDVNVRLDESWARLSAGGRIDDLAQPLSIEVAGELAPAQLLPLIGDAGSGTGRISLGANATVREAIELFRGPAFDWAEALRRIQGTALVDIALEDLALDDAFAGAAVAGVVEVRFDERGVSATSIDGLIASAGAPGPALVRQLPAFVQSLATGPLVLALGGISGTPTALHLAAADDGLKLLANSSARLRGAALDLTMRGSGQLTLGNDLAVRAMDLPGVSLTIDQLEITGAAVTGEGQFSAISGTPDAFVGDLSLTITTTGIPVEGATLEQGQLKTNGRVAWQRGELSIAPAGGGELSVVGLGWQDQFYVPGPTVFRLADVANEVSIDAASGAVRFALETEPSQIMATALLPGAETAEIVVTMPGLATLGSTIADTLVDVRGASFTASEPPLAASAVDARLHHQDGFSFLQLRVGELSYDIESGLVAHVGLDLNAEFGPSEVAFAAQATALNGAVAAQAEGRHELASGDGGATFGIDPVMLGAPGVQLRDLAPGLGDTVSDARGSIALAGRAEWGASGMTSAVALELANISFDASGTTVASLGGTIAFDNLLPATTPPGQMLRGSVALADGTAMPFEIVAALRPDGTMVVENLLLQAVGGRVRASEVVIDPSVLPLDLTLVVETVDLAELLAVLPVEGLSGSGRISGTVPVRVSSDAIAVNDGKLAAEGPGRLKYTGSALADQLGDHEDGVGLALQALSDFHFDSLRLEASKPESGEGVVTLHLEGANPAVLDGYPFVFNINLESDFDRLAQLALEGVGAADNILRWAHGQTLP